MKVKFVPQNTEVEIKPGQSVLEVAHQNGIPIRSTCNGMPSCAECRVRVTEGEYNLVPPSKKELSLIGTGYYIDQRRLSCQIQCFGDVTIDTTEHLDRAGEGPITKKFLSRVQKSKAEDSHSVGGIFIEQEEQVLKEVSDTVKPGSVSDSAAPAGEFLRKSGRSGGGRARPPKAGASDGRPRNSKQTASSDGRPRSPNATTASDQPDGGTPKGQGRGRRRGRRR